jgi:hypothetical protein
VNGIFREANKKL